MITRGSRRSESGVHITVFDLELGTPAFTSSKQTYARDGAYGSAIFAVGRSSG